MTLPMLTPEAAETVAADIRTPIGSFGPGRAGCGVDHGTHRVYFLVDGRTAGPFVGPSFEAPRNACMLARVLNWRIDPCNLVVPNIPEPTFEAVVTEVAA